MNMPQKANDQFSWIVFLMLCGIVSATVFIFVENYIGDSRLWQSIGVFGLTLIISAAILLLIARALVSRQNTRRIERSARPIRQIKREVRDRAIDDDLNRVKEITGIARK